MATSAQRAKLVELAGELIHHAAEIHYAQTRPYPFHLKAPAYPITLDCSSAVTLLCKWAGLHDPNGPNYNYDGYGYTGTLLDGPCPHYFTASHAKQGAIVIFGPGTGEHAAMVIGDLGTNPLLFSHGNEAGPIAIRLHDEAQYHAPPTTFLSIAHL
jgi:hypothetical protein